MGTVVFKVGQGGDLKKQTFLEITRKSLLNQVLKDLQVFLSRTATAETSLGPVRRLS